MIPIIVTWLHNTKKNIKGFQIIITRTTEWKNKALQISYCLRNTELYTHF